MKYSKILVQGNSGLNDTECPFPLGIIPNLMGINLCSVKSVEWVEQSDGQLVTITINFDPCPALSQLPHP